MDGKIDEIIDILEMLLDDLPLKVKQDIDSVIGELRKLDRENPDTEKLMHIEDSLELLSTSPNIDSYARYEIINVLTTIEAMYN